MRESAMTISEAREAMKGCLEVDDPEARAPILLRGDHGIGKSDLVKQIAREYGYSDDQIIDIRASLMVEGDLIGMPEDSSFADFLVEGVTALTDGYSGAFPEWVNSVGEMFEDRFDIRDFTRWKPPEWLKRAQEEPVVLFFDEVDRAMMTVRQGLFQLTGSREVYGTELHPDTVVFGAINGGEEVTDYMVGEMDPAELDRWWCIDLQPTAEEWFEWAEEEGINKYVFEFLSDNPDFLDPEYSEDHGQKVRPSRRSWHRLSLVLDEQYDATEKPDPSWVYLHSQGHVGQEAALKFQEFVDEYEDAISIDDILNDDEDREVIQRAVEEGENLQNALCIQFENQYGGEDDAEELSRSQLENLAHFMVGIRDEQTVRLFKSIENTEVRKDLFDIEHPEIGNFGEWFLEAWNADDDVKDDE